MSIDGNDRVVQHARLGSIGTSVNHSTSRRRRLQDTTIGRIKKWQDDVSRHEKYAKQRIITHRPLASTDYRVLREVGEAGSTYGTKTSIQTDEHWYQFGVRP